MPVSLGRASLIGANLAGAKFMGTYLTFANLSGANLSNTKVLSANLSDANLINANLSGSDMTRRHEWEDYTILHDANLTGANIRGANLFGVNLTDAILVNADLSGADLSNTTLFGVDLTGAVLTNVKLAGSRFNKYTTWPVGYSVQSPQEVTPEPTQTADTSLELEFWQSIKNSDDPDMFRAYLTEFPEGKFVLLAEINLKKFGRASSTVPSVIPDLNYGRFHALVIGNNDYQDLSDLQTAINDAEGVAWLLESEYDFEVHLIKDATRSDIIDTLAGLRRTVGSQDNLLIYYAGHGVLDEATNRGYWLPVDADRYSPSNWIQSDTVAAQIGGMKAKHVLVVADSCFSGALMRGIVVSKQKDDDYLQTLVKKKARTAMTSGGLEPVMDAGGGGHSVFARALLTLLEENTGVLDASELFSQLRPKVMSNSDQTPEYGYIHKTGHDGEIFCL